MSGNLASLLRDLHRRKARERRGLVVAEGARLVQDALDSGARIAGVLAADDVVHGPFSGMLKAAQGRGLRTEVVPRKEFNELADTDSPSGILAVIEWQPLELAQLPPAPASGVVLVLDAVQDPGNVGTMIRTALALGAWATIALDGTADVRGAKVVRGSMGALFRHPVAAAHFGETAAWLAAAGITPVLAAADGDALARLPGVARAALVVGSEGHGVREAWSALDHRRVTIPMRAGAESLNAAVAAGILLHALASDGA